MQPRRGFWPVLALVLLAHGAVLTQLSTAPDPVPHGRAGAAPVQVLYVRAVQPQPGAPPQATPEAPVAPQPEPLATLATPAPAETRALPRVERPSGAGAEPPASPASAVAAVTGPVAETPYYPRGELTVAPRLLSTVVVPFPEDVKGVVELNVRISLFIDEQGGVRRIRIDTPNIPAPFERAVRDAFSPAQFAPGEIQATAVRSQVRLEVEFRAPPRLMR